jgi:large subunit ribosomal protein L30
MPGKVRIKYVKSAIGHNLKQKRTIKALGFRKLGDEVERKDTSVLRGMIQRVAHLVTVEEVES